MRTARQRVHDHAPLARALASCSFTFCSMNCGSPALACVSTLSPRGKLVASQGVGRGRAAAALPPLPTGAARPSVRQLAPVMSV